MEGLMLNTVLLVVLILLVLINIFLILFRKSDNNVYKEQLIKIDSDLNRIDPLIRDEQARSREEYQRSLKANREEQGASLRAFEESFTRNVKDFNELQRQKFGDLSARQDQIRKETENRLSEIRSVVELKLQSLQTENNKKLDEMRILVDEKLQQTMEKRFNESFRLISERLEEVHKGLGEMQSLAAGVGDLKKVLTNVKTRGNLGEIQLGAILEQILSPDQYVCNAIVKHGSQERVEFAIRLPDKNSDDNVLLLPIDSKFPNEDYMRLVDAYEHLDSLNTKEFDMIIKQFESSVKKNAKTIKEKYINPPFTTDFAIMFVPTEGLYAEVLRRTGLFETLQRDYKITVVGPTNLVAFLSSLQLGFKTLAIEKRSSEVWELLGAVKTQFGAFGTILEKTKKKLQEATNVIDQAGVRSRVIERKLKNVQEIPKDQSELLLGDISEDIDTELLPENSQE